VRNNESDKEELEDLLNESKLFKYKVSLVEEIEKKLDLYNWKNEVNSLSTLKSENKDIKSRFTLEDVNSLIVEGKERNFGK
jgi:hypothetical protein